MAKNEKPTALELEASSQTPEQLMAETEQRIAAMMANAQAAAEEKIALANKILDDAKYAAASVPVAAEKKTFSQEVNELAKMTMVKRMEQQFGTPDQVKWVRNVVIPIDQHGAEETMSVTVNGVGYDFLRGGVYDMPEALYEVIQRNRYVESDIVKRARTGQLVTTM